MKPDLSLCLARGVPLVVSLSVASGVFAQSACPGPLFECVPGGGPIIVNPKPTPPPGTFVITEVTPTFGTDLDFSTFHGRLGSDGLHIIPGQIVKSGALAQAVAKNRAKIKPDAVYAISDPTVKDGASFIISSGQELLR